MDELGLLALKKYFMYAFEAVTSEKHSFCTKYEASDHNKELERQSMIADPSTI